VFSVRSPFYAVDLLRLICLATTNNLQQSAACEEAVYAAGCCRLSDVELCDNLMLLILAGHDTSRWAAAAHTKT
jgi:hypothetical protein